MTGTVYLLVSVDTKAVFGVYATTALAAAERVALHQRGFRLHIQPWEVAQ